MILRLSFEELTTLNAAAKRMLATPEGAGVLAPPEVLAELEARLPLEGDISVATLGEQARLLGAVDLVLDRLKQRMDDLVVEQYVGSDDAVNAYFDYANVLELKERLAGLGREMEALIEVMTGHPATAASAEAIAFPD
jgi:hypothetical protein